MDNLIHIIMEWIFHNYGGLVELKIGIWDESADPHNFYAIIADRHGNVITGENSYGSYSPEEALRTLVEELGLSITPRLKPALSAVEGAGA